MLDDGSVGVLIAVAKDSCKVLTNKVGRAGPHSKGCYPLSAACTCISHALS